eukprot:11204552-Ditylum_brightwellii.AAC.1
MNRDGLDDERDQDGDTNKTAVRWWKVAVIEQGDFSRCQHEDKLTVVMDPNVMSNEEDTRH